MILSNHTDEVDVINALHKANTLRKNCKSKRESLKMKYPSKAAEIDKIRCNTSNSEMYNDFMKLLRDVAKEVDSPSAEVKESAVIPEDSRAPDSLFSKILKGSNLAFPKDSDEHEKEIATVGDVDHPQEKATKLDAKTWTKRHRQLIKEILTKCAQNNTNIPEKIIKQDPFDNQIRIQSNYDAAEKKKVIQVIFLKNSSNKPWITLRTYLFRFLILDLLHDFFDGYQSETGRTYDLHQDKGMEISIFFGYHIQKFEEYFSGLERSWGTYPSLDHADFADIKHYLNSIKDDEVVNASGRVVKKGGTLWKRCMQSQRSDDIGKLRANLVALKDAGYKKILSKDFALEEYISRPFKLRPNVGDSTLAQTVLVDADKKTVQLHSIMETFIEQARRRPTKFSTLDYPIVYIKNHSSIFDQASTPSIERLINSIEEDYFDNDGVHDLTTQSEIKKMQVQFLAGCNGFDKLSIFMDYELTFTKTDLEALTSLEKTKFIFLILYRMMKEDGLIDLSSHQYSKIHDISAPSSERELASKCMLESFLTFLNIVFDSVYTFETETYPEASDEMKRIVKEYLVGLKTGEVSTEIATRDTDYFLASDDAPEYVYKFSIVYNLIQAFKVLLVHNMADAEKNASLENICKLSPYFIHSAVGQRDKSIKELINVSISMKNASNIEVSDVIDIAIRKNLNFDVGKARLIIAEFIQKLSGRFIQCRRIYQETCIKKGMHIQRDAIIVRSKSSITTLEGFALHSLFGDEYKESGTVFSKISKSQSELLAEKPPSGDDETNVDSQEASLSVRSICAFLCSKQMKYKLGNNVSVLYLDFIIPTSMKLNMDALHYILLCDQKYQIEDAANETVQAGKKIRPVFTTLDRNCGFLASLFTAELETCIEDHSLVAGMNSVQWIPKHIAEEELAALLKNEYSRRIVDSWQPGDSQPLGLGGCNKLSKKAQVKRKKTAKYIKKLLSDNQD